LHRNCIIQKDLQGESDEHQKNVKEAFEGSAKMELMIIFLSISLVLSGISLIMENKRSKYTLLGLVVLMYLVGVGLFGIALI